MTDFPRDQLIASVRRLTALREAADSAADVHDAMAQELLALTGADEVHLHHLSDTGSSELAVRYTLSPERARHPYVVPAGAADSGVEWVASAHRPLVAPAQSQLPAELVGVEQIAGAALLPVPVDGRVPVVAVLVGRERGLLDEQRLELAGMLVEIAAGALELIEARTAARTDPLTGLLNHGAMLSRLHEEIDRARRQETPLACLLLDLDDFKAINDRFGHLMGDGILRRVADTLHREFRRFDRVARYGGDEFVVILPNASAQRAQIAAERALDRLRAIRIECDGERYPLTASIGAASWGLPDSPQDLLARADGALRESKLTGKDRLAIAAHDESERAPAAQFSA